MSEENCKNSLLIEHNKDQLYSTFAVTNFILDYLSDFPITNLKLQKLIFLAYGLHLSLYNEKLFNEPIEAWKLGPVIKSVYKEFTTYGSAPITTKARIAKEEDYTEEIFITPEIPPSCEKEKLSMISTCLFFGNKTAAQLVDFTHEMNAWQEAIRIEDRILLDINILQDFKNKGLANKIVDYANQY